MPISKKGKVKEFIQNQMLFGNTETGTQMKAKVIGRINAMSPDDPKLVDLMYDLSRDRKEFGWEHMIAIANSLGLLAIAFLGFFS